jgi:hypothetical protein
MTVLVDPDFPPTRSESHCRCDGPASWPGRTIGGRPLHGNCDPRFP